MDVQMPELYGADVAMVLRHERAIATPIYLLSTLDEAERDRCPTRRLHLEASRARASVSEVRRILG